MRCAAGFSVVSDSIRVTVRWVRSRVDPPAPGRSDDPLGLDERVDAEAEPPAAAEVVAGSLFVLAEADRFPDISAAWFEGAFHRSLILLGESMTRLAERGMLRDLADPTLAAYQFAGLVMYKPMNQAMFSGTGARPTAGELEHIADRAAEVFLAAYGPS